MRAEKALIRRPWAVYSQFVSCDTHLSFLIRINCPTTNLTLTTEWKWVKINLTQTIVDLFLPILVADWFLDQLLDNFTLTKDNIWVLRDTNLSKTTYRSPLIREFSVLVKIYWEEIVNEINNVHKWQNIHYIMEYFWSIFQKFINKTNIKIML